VVEEPIQEPLVRVPRETKVYLVPLQQKEVAKVAMAAPQVEMVAVEVVQATISFKTICSLELEHLLDKVPTEVPAMMLILGALVEVVRLPLVVTTMCPMAKVVMEFRAVSRAPQCIMPEEGEELLTKP
jgi:hypothetical protein